MAEATVQTQETRQCSRCRRTLPVEEFVSARRSAKPVAYCASCRAHAREKYARAKPPGQIDRRFAVIRELSGQVKTCTACHAELPIECFTPHKAGAGGRESRCRDCLRTYWSARNRAGHFDYSRQREPKERRKERLKYFYGLTPEQYDAMVAAQSGRCAICRTDTPGGRAGHWAVDHDHATHRVRGLLCNGCNLALGLMRDNPTAMREAAAYLERHSGAMVRNG